MKITNKKGLPKIVYNAICAKWYSGSDEKKDFSVTETLNPIKIVLLSKRHDDEMEKDASDMLWTIFGSAVHLMIEQGNKDNKDVIMEERYNVRYRDKVFSGQVDCYDIKQKAIYDVKTTKVYSHIFGSEKGGVFDKWRLQTSIYAYFMKVNGKEVNETEIIEIFKDFDPDCVNNRNYPIGEICNLPLTKLSDDEVLDHLDAFLDAYEKYKDVPDDEIPVCSPDERWQKGSSFAVTKIGASRATKVLKSRKEAEDFINGLPDKLRFEIEVREGVPKRCLKYCDCNKFCNFYQNYIKGGSKNESKEVDNSGDANPFANLH